MYRMANSRVLEVVSAPAINRSKQTIMNWSSTEDSKDCLLV